ncbi:glucosylceramidase, putative [Perkinsus marinus ATCC 50983]|uniref:Glucosylceramidase, putative n=1 Tax=Perkinsus marinus (strain ATCC 50983 / TXsc) TaxID=423536 RepID=C5LPQ1_PERM5|nr:glucosylceramidase, putative [Perkinsus marinus ATCC 50983]EER01292.1 glucosylceramidase, putative [Perkinsus marinus ATCC 50983]|eukprot:XP_002768574.1 glucosylceramidase, putative [Perkinsus marinus ATCC 50983]
MNGSPNPCLKEDPRYHRAWADYLVKWVDAYEKLGVPIWAITQQNEPQNYITQNWATCIFTPEAQLAFIRDHLGPAMKAANKSTKLLFNDDDKNFLPEVAKLIIEDDVAAE